MTASLRDQFKLIDKLRQADRRLRMDRWAIKAGIHWMRFCEIKLGYVEPTASEIAALSRALGIPSGLHSHRPASPASSLVATPVLSSGRG